MSIGLLIYTIVIMIMRRKCFSSPELRLANSKYTYPSLNKGGALVHKKMISLNQAKSHPLVTLYRVKKNLLLHF